MGVVLYATNRNNIGTFFPVFLIPALVEKPDFRICKMKMTVGLKKAPSRLVASSRIDK